MNNKGKTVTFEQTSTDARCIEPMERNPNEFIPENEDNTVTGKESNQHEKCCFHENPGNNPMCSTSSAEYSQGNQL